MVCPIICRLFCARLIFSSLPTMACDTLIRSAFSWLSLFVASIATTWPRLRSANEDAWPSTSTLVVLSYCTSTPLTHTLAKPVMTPTIPVPPMPSAAFMPVPPTPEPASTPVPPIPSVALMPVPPVPSACTPVPPTPEFALIPVPPAPSGLAPVPPIPSCCRPVPPMPALHTPAPALAKLVNKTSVAVTKMARCFCTV